MIILILRFHLTFENLKNKQMKRLVTILLLLVSGLFIKAQNNRIPIGDQEIFISGMNLAWVNFAQDLTQFNESSFTQALDDIAQVGGNSMRWWLHVNGKYSPQWTGYQISGISDTELNNLEKALDLAADRNIVISLCLWSFDMLQPNAGTENYERNKNFLNNLSATNSYINNALIPMVEKVKEHEAILCWEIFNEPEGMSSEFGWTPEQVSMEAIQRFINLCAGAIHRTDSTALVSNGSWSFKASSDIWGGSGDQKNYYSDEELIAQGGDEDGTLDFYMVHYYSWGGTTLSPFHHPASYWELDKPIVIAEFAAAGPIEGVSALDAYTYLYENGYAGAMAWTWTNHDGHGGVEDAAPGMQYLFLNYPEDIAINIGNGNHIPLVTEAIPDAFLSMDAGLVENYHDLTASFWDYEDSTNLVYTVISVTNPSMVSATVNEDNFLELNVTGESSGYAYVKLKAMDSGGKYTTTGFNVNIYDPANENLAYQKPVTASSTEDNEKLPEYAVDGDIETRWSSLYADNQNFIIDLEDEYPIGTIKLYWEAAYTKEYDVLLSLDNENWTTVYSTTSGSGGTETVEFSGTMARYVKLNLNKRATEWGHSLWEIEIYRKPVGTDSEKNQAINLFPNPTNGSFVISMENTTKCNRIDILDKTGKIVKQINMKKQESIYKGNLPKPGVYFIILRSDNNQITKKIVVI